MSGHSKWSNIKRKKGVEDAKKGTLFTKLAKDITIAAKEGGGDVNANPSLRSTVDKAKEYNMPKANIERAIAKGTGEGGKPVEEVKYEGYGPGGVAFLIICVTDNKNRTVSDVRAVFNKTGGSLADAGSVSYIFSGNPPVASFKIPLGEEDKAKFEQLHDSLYELDDILHIYHNGEI